MIAQLLVLGETCVNGPLTGTSPKRTVGSLHEIILCTRAYRYIWGGEYNI